MKFSIISPVYNVSKHIRSFIKSINNQICRDFELLLVNDGSTDDSIELALDELKKTNIKYRIINKKNGGQSTARNVGIKEAKGDWIVIIDSDDAIQSNYLSSFEQIVDNNKCEVAICDINRVTDSNILSECNDEFNYEIESGKKYFEDFIMHRIEIGPYSLCINRKELLKKKLLFNEKSRYSEEFIFICELLHDSNVVVHLKQRTYNYCLRNGSVSTSASIEKIVNGHNEIIKSNQKYSACNCASCKVYNKYAMARWVIATARFTSKNLDYESYKSLLISLEYKKYKSILKHIPDLKVKLAAFLLYTNLRISYTFFKKVGRY